MWAQVAAALVCAALLAVSTAAAASTASPELALALVTGASQPRLILEQRQIDRTWGLSEDSVYREVDVPGWKSEGFAAAMSAAVPGAGQAYAGSRRAWMYALAEVAGWTTRLLERRRAHDVRNEAAAYVGAPDDSTSRWSFRRWERETHQDAGRWEALYARDRASFYDQIASEPGLLAGWDGDATATRRPFTTLWDDGDSHLRAERWSDTLLWINHAVSAVDALRAVRGRNIALGPSTRLGLSTGWRRGAPTFAAVLRRSF